MARRLINHAAKFVLGGAVLVASTTSVLCATATTSPLDTASSHLKKAFKAHIQPWDYNWDNRNFDQSDDKKYSIPKFTRHILLVRHGQYHFADNDADCHLTALGKDQTDLTGQRLKALNFPYKRIVYSTMTRAIESKNEISKYLSDVPTVSCDLLREGAPFPPVPSVPGWPPNGAKSFETDGRRIEQAFSVFIHRAEPTQTEDAYEVLVCHANVIRYFVCRALQLPPEAWIRMSLDHGSLTWLTIRPSGNVSVRWVGNSGFMPRDKLSV